MPNDSRGEYEARLPMKAPPQAVFDFVADVRNLPRYLPTTKDAQSQGPDRVRVQGEAQGHRYDADGYLRRDPDARRLSWGADEGYYSGWMQVEPDGDDASSSVTIHLSMRGHPPGAGDDEGPAPEDIEEGLQRGLESIRNFVEGRGGKEEPRAAT